MEEPQPSLNPRVSGNVYIRGNAVKCHILVICSEVGFRVILLRFPLQETSMNYSTCGCHIHGATLWIKQVCITTDIGRGRGRGSGRQIPGRSVLRRVGRSRRLSFIFLTVQGRSFAVSLFRSRRTYFFQIDTEGNRLALLCHNAGRSANGRFRAIQTLARPFPICRLSSGSGSGSRLTALVHLLLQPWALFSLSSQDHKPHTVHMYSRSRPAG